MKGLENPILRYELRGKLRSSKFVPAMFLRLVCLLLLFSLVLLAYLGRGILAFVLAESLLILLFTPGTVFKAFSSDSRHGNFQELALTRLSSPAILLGKLIAADLYTFILIILSAIVMCSVAIFHSNLSIWRLLYANAALLILIFSSSVVGLAVFMILRWSRFTGYVLIYALIILLISNVIILSPLIERLQSNRAKDAIVKFALYTNPLIMAARALGNMDLMRSRYIYDMADPIVNRGFTYPSWYFIGGIYFAASCLLLIPISIGFRIKTFLLPV